MRLGGAHRVWQKNIVVLNFSLTAHLLNCELPLTSTYQTGPWAALSECADLPEHKGVPWCSAGLGRDAIFFSS
jgi:hypothetical protein